MAQLYQPVPVPMIDKETGLVSRQWQEFFQRLAQAVPSGGSAPVDAQYIVAAVNAILTAERVATNTSTVTWDFSTPGQAKANATGFVTTTGTPTTGVLAKFSSASSITDADAAAVSAALDLL